MDLGIKQGLTKAFLIGSMGTIYVVWAFQAWVGSVLVIERREKGGIVFIAGVCIIVAGVWVTLLQTVIILPIVWLYNMQWQVNAREMFAISAW